MIRIASIVVVVDLLHLLQWQSEAVLQLLMSGVWVGRNFGKLRQKLTF